MPIELRKLQAFHGLSSSLTWFRRSSYRVLAVQQKRYLDVSGTDSWQQMQLDFLSNCETPAWGGCCGLWWVGSGLSLQVAHAWSHGHTRTHTHTAQVSLSLSLSVFAYSRPRLLLWYCLLTPSKFFPTSRLDDCWTSWPHAIKVNDAVYIMPLSRYGRYGEVLLFSVLSSSQNVLHFGSSEPKRLV